jgi:DNA-nicking Smr family endonuclease
MSASHDPAGQPPESSPHTVPIEDTLDLHTFAPRDVPVVVAEYLEAAHGRGLHEVRVIHGRGTGAQRAIVHRLLRGHPLVAEFWDARDAHLGATIVRLVAARG